MSIKIDVPPAELVDKVTILEIKLERIKDAAKLENVRIEHSVLVRTMEAHIPIDDTMRSLQAELKRLNEIIWQAEEDLRTFERKKEYGASFIEAARAVYFTNDKRAEAKRKINDLLGSRLLEEKSHDPY